MGSEPQTISCGKYSRLLFELVEQPVEEIAAMPREEVLSILKEEGIDPVALGRKTRQLVEEVRAKHRLDAAGHRRKALERLKEEWKNRIALDPAAVRREVLSRLAGPGAASNNTVLACFRTLEVAPDEDFVGMLDDLDLLDALSQIEEHE